MSLEILDKEGLLTFIADLRRSGVLEYKDAAIALKLAPPPPDSSGPVVPETQAIGEAAGMPTDDELLFASTPWVPDIAAGPPPVEPE